eukprot:134164-Prorocentrum_lima.AAC.1
MKKRSGLMKEALKRSMKGRSSLRGKGSGFKTWNQVRMKALERQRSKKSSLTMEALMWKRTEKEMFA